MKRTFPTKSSFFRHLKDSTTKKPLTNKTYRLRKSLKPKFKKTDYYHPTYQSKKNTHLTKSYSNIYGNKTEHTEKGQQISPTPTPQQQEGSLVGVDLTYLTALRQEAYDELHRQMQHYNDSFVIQMQQVEQQQQQQQQRKTPLTGSDGQRPAYQRRRSSTQLLHHRLRRTSLVPTSKTYQQQQENESSIEELVDLLETGTIKDYSLLTEWELCQVGGTSTCMHFITHTHFFFFFPSF
ncbi:hypothetical protein BC941DRAFT_430453 [Chlamydoabsidia padenii]|nr:hypothetical protein BC941DRAFT_430453 [Chlamydoabsidia padenii]